uniref:lymphocyte activation gene 3 protein-like n=1 Tax=Doryrhamphus excisus TaxID=161450 RepID=UPI0025AE3EB8|nr:lymphocyte activation gene 3 protein-like [Doryrhamphus excisus]
MLFEFLVFGLISFSMTEGHHEVQEVFAESNSKVVLPCVCNTSSRVIIWRKVNQGTVWRQEKSGMQFWGSRWLQNGARRVRCPHSRFERGDCSLHISNIREDDGGVFECRFISGGQFMTRSVMLRVIKVSVSSAAPVAGIKFSVHCGVTPEPVGASVQWRLNNSMFVSPSGKNLKTAQWTIEETASVTLTGEWTCVVAHRGFEGRASASLTVKGIIHPPRDDARVYAAVGCAATLPCVFSPGSIPSKPSWRKLHPGSSTKPGRLPSSFSSSSPASKPAWDQSVRVEDVGLEDEGRYTCAGVVGGQSLSRRMQLVIAKIDRGVSWMKMVTLTCQLTDTSEVMRYEWVHVTYDPSGTRLVKSIQEGKTLYMGKVNVEDVGEWVCRFHGKERLLGNVTHRIAPQNGSTSSLYNTSFVLSLSVLLVLLVLILVQLYKKHQRRKKIFQFSALETILHVKVNEHDKREESQVKK